MADLGKLNVAAFSVTVENDAEIRAWIDRLGKARDAAEAALKALVDLCDTTPMIQMTLHRSGQIDGSREATDG